jgi:hypothetical protein
VTLAPDEPSPKSTVALTGSAGSPAEPDRVASTAKVTRSPVYPKGLPASSRIGEPGTDGSGDWVIGALDRVAAETETLGCAECKASGDNVGEGLGVGLAHAANSQQSPIPTAPALDMPIAIP